MGKAVDRSWGASETVSNGGLTEGPEGGTECSCELWGAAEGWELLGV